MAPRLSSPSPRLDRTAVVRRKQPALTRLALFSLLGVAACGPIEVDADTKFIPVPLALARDGSMPLDAGNPDVVEPMDVAETGAGDVGTDAVMFAETGDVPALHDMMSPPDTGNDASDVVDSGGPTVDVPADGPTCTPTSVVVGNDNVIVAAHGTMVPVVINFSGECPTLRSGAVQARISSRGAPLPMFGVTMTTLEATRARGVIDLTTPELTGFPLNTYMISDGSDNALTGNMFPAGFTLPVDFVIDRVVPGPAAVTAVSFDRNATSYSFSFMGDSNGRVIFDVKTVAGDAGPVRSLLAHGTRTPCTLSRGTVPGRSDSTGCGSDSRGEAQSCVYIDGDYICESNRLMFPVTATVRASHRISDLDYNAVIGSVSVPRTPLTFVWTYQDNRGNTSVGTRSIMMLN